MRIKQSQRISGLKSFLKASALQQFGRCLLEERYESARDAVGLACQYGATNRDIQRVIKGLSQLS